MRAKEDEAKVSTISVPEAGKRLGVSKNSAYEAAKRGVNGTPTVLINGKQLSNPTPEAITSAVG